MSSPPAPVDHAAAHRRRVLVGCGKFLLAFGILAVLFYRLRGEDVFARLVNEPKHWGALALAQCLVLAAISLNYMRWYVLVRALQLDFRPADAFRLGSIGMLINQILPAGSVGGDLFKAVFIAREQPGKRTEAVASVLIDRVVGLYAMMLVASAGYLFGSRNADLGAAIETAGRTVVGAALVGTLGIALLMTPLLTHPRMRAWVAGWPVVGATAARLIGAAAAYRHSRRTLFAGIIMSCCTHTLFVLAFWLIGQGLPLSAPSLSTMLVIGPLSLAAGAAIPTPGGLGGLEAALDELFVRVGSPRGDGLLVAITYRVMTYVMAAVGAVYYVRARRAVAQVLHEAEELADDRGDLLA
jgi:uncharacterized membrane protein YbhN (UPF0104 family)